MKQILILCAFIFLCFQASIANAQKKTIKKSIIKQEKIIAQKAVKPKTKVAYCFKKIACSIPDQVCLKRGNLDLVECKQRASGFFLLPCLRKSQKMCLKKVKEKKNKAYKICLGIEANRCKANSKYKNFLAKCPKIYATIIKSCITKAFKSCKAPKLKKANLACLKTAKKSVSVCQEKIEKNVAKCYLSFIKNCVAFQKKPKQYQLCVEKERSKCNNDYRKGSQACMKVQKEALAICNCGKFICSSCKE